MSIPPTALGFYKKIRAEFALTAVIILFFPLFCQASNYLDVVVSEIAWMGTQIESVEPKDWWRYEWFELYNNTPFAVSLKGWQLELYRTELDWTLVIEGEIVPGGYFLGVSSDKIPFDFNQNYSNLSGKFFNNGQILLLRDPEGFVVDKIDCSLGWFAGDNNTKQTMERKNPLFSGNETENWQNSENPYGTPGKNNILESFLPEGVSTEEKNTKDPSKTAHFPKITINEILPSPKGADETDEWIEIFNNENFDIDLTGWKIADTEGKTVSYAFEDKKIMTAKNFLLFKRPETKITLNNEGDCLELINPGNNVSDRVCYENAPLDLSYIFQEDGWSWSKTLTPGSENIISAQDKYVLSSETENSDVANNTSETASGEKRSKLTSFSQNTVKNKGFPTIFTTAGLFAVFSGFLLLALKKSVAKQ